MFGDVKNTHFSFTKQQSFSYDHIIGNVKKHCNFKLIIYSISINTNSKIITLLYNEHQGHQTVLIEYRFVLIKDNVKCFIVGIKIRFQ